MQPVKISKLGWVWLASLCLCFGAYWGLSYLDTATILWPHNDNILEVVIWAAAGMGLVSVVIGFTSTSGAMVSRLIVAILVYGLGGSLSTMALFATVSNIVQNRVYFPASNTRTFTALIPIDRAYLGHSRGCVAENTCWNVQTSPLWSDLNVFEDDYQFMLDNRSPDDVSDDTEEISSRGFHCLQVKVQKAGTAIRIMDAGSSTLSKGSVVLCPDGRSVAIILDPIEN